MAPFRVPFSWALALQSDTNETSVPSPTAGGIRRVLPPRFESQSPFQNEIREPPGQNAPECTGATTRITGIAD